jgi:hypothetical protein
MEDCQQDSSIGHSQSAVGKEFWSNGTSLRHGSSFSSSWYIMGVFHSATRRRSRRKGGVVWNTSCTRLQAAAAVSVPSPCTFCQPFPGRIAGAAVQVPCRDSLLGHPLCAICGISSMGHFWPGSCLALLAGCSR